MIVYVCPTVPRHGSPRDFRTYGRCTVCAAVLSARWGQGFGLTGDVSDRFPEADPLEPA